MELEEVLKEIKLKKINSLILNLNYVCTQFEIIKEKISNDEKVSSSEINLLGDYLDLY
jgi:hypothetical protein